MSKPERMTEAEARSLADRLVSPHGFDGTGPVPDEVTKAARRIAELRVKFVSTPGMEQPLTTRDVEELFDASAITAEWSRELLEARDALDVSQGGAR